MTTLRPRVVFTANARVDLRDIRRYSRRTWGVEQSNRYEQRLLIDIERLRDHPALGQSIPDPNGDVRRILSERHFIVYEAYVDRIVILRIMHERFNVTAHVLRGPE